MCHFVFAVACRRSYAIVCWIAALVLAVAGTCFGQTLAPAPGSNRPDVRYGKVPISFELNQGQTNSSVKFLSRGRGYALFLTADQAVLSLRSRGAFPGAEITQSRHGSGLTKEGAIGPLPTPPSGPNYILRSRGSLSDMSTVLRLTLVGANPSAKVVGMSQLPGKSNYFIGNDPKNWRTGVPTYAEVRYKDIYPGIDLIYYGNQSGELEYDFVVGPGADPTAIRLGIGKLLSSMDKSSHLQRLRLVPSGDLVLEQAAGGLRLKSPVVYQEDEHGRRHYIAAKYVLQRTSKVSGARAELAFDLGPYDSHKPLVIDPILTYSTYVSGSGNDFGSGIAVDSSGNAYVTGNTNSPDFPTMSPFQSALAGTTNAFVFKLNAAGNALIYSTYLGGSGNDSGARIAIDASGEAYVIGSTNSPDFPTVNPIQSSLKGAQNAFVAKLNASGNGLVYSTYLGGSGNDTGASIAVDSSDNVYITGNTTSADFPLVGAIQSTNKAVAGGYTAFVSELNAVGNALIYSTYLGGSTYDGAGGIAVDSSGNTYVTGSAHSPDFPTKNPLQGTFAACGAADCANAFITEINSTGSALVYSTFLGGNTIDSGDDIAVDSAGDAYVAGWTLSTNFPTVNPFQASIGNPNETNAFVAKLNPTGSALIFSTYLGGAVVYGNGIRLDSAGNAYVAGYTGAGGFPTVNPIQGYGGGVDVFVTKFDPTGNVVYSTYLGGPGNDFGLGIAVDSSGGAYVTGYSYSYGFPTTSGAYQTSRGKGISPYISAFVAKIAGKVPSSTTLSTSANPSILNQSVTFTAQVSAAPPATGTPTGTVTFNDGSNAIGTGTLNSSGQATLTISSLAVGSHSITAAYSGDSNFNASTSAPLTQQVQYEPAGTICYGAPGHQILQPINADGSSVWKQGATIPAKFRVCDANGVSIGTPGLVSSFFLTSIISGTVTTVDETVSSTTPDTAFRWDSTNQQWIFNISTASLAAGDTYVYNVTLNDGTSIVFQYGLR